MIDTDGLIAEVQAAFMVGDGWQALADRPDLVERIMYSTPYMDPSAAEVVRAIYRAQQEGYTVVLEWKEP